MKDTVYRFRKKKLKKPEFPEIIQIETSIMCNAKCVSCPHKEIKRKINMDFPMIKKIIDESAKYQVKELHPFNYGEPFLYSKFIETLEYAKSKMPKVKVFIYSNGSAMTDKQMDEVIRKRLIDKINFSIDAASPETYKKFKGLDYKTTVSKVNKFLEINRRYGNPAEVSVSFVINDLNKNELNAFKNQWKNKLRHIHLTTDDGRAGKPFINRASKHPCSWIFERAVILTDGKLVMCCVDTKGRIILGDFNKNTIKEIWDSQAYEKIRKLHLSGKKSLIPMCKNCYVRY